jgi:hypothetical protein
MFDDDDAGDALDKISKGVSYFQKKSIYCVPRIYKF